MNKGEKAKSVLIIDDDEKIRKMLTFLFLAKGFAVKDAGNGAEAFTALKEVTPDVIIVDLMMPVMDGFEFCERIKKDALLRHIPLIVLSALSRSEYRKRIEPFNVYECIEKPFRSSDVVNKALEALGQAQA